VIVLSSSALANLNNAQRGLEVTGWVISPYLDHAAIESMCKIFQNLARYETALPDIKKTGLTRANDELSAQFARSILLYSRSASVVGLMMSLPHTKQFSHLYEMALVQRYRVEQPAALMMALPLVEGLALAISGWRFGDATRSVREAVKNITPSAVLSGMNRQLFDVLHAQVTSFVDIAYARTSGGLGVANLNRYYIMHGLGEEPTSFPGNVSRVFMVLEVLAALDQLNANGVLSLPDSASLPQVAGITRERFYESVLGEALSDVNLLKVEYLEHHALFDKAVYYGND
jgi:hypothetical protein